MPRIVPVLLLGAAACSAPPRSVPVVAKASTPSTAPAPSVPPPQSAALAVASTTPLASPAPSSLQPSSAVSGNNPTGFKCTEVIGLTITAEWYGAGFEQLVDDARFQARTRPHTFVDQWADPRHEAWSAPITSPCADGSMNPDRVVLFAANWKLSSEDEWVAVLRQLAATAKSRYPALRDLQLYTVLRGPKNQSCGDPKSVVEPMVDAAIARVAAEQPSWVHAGPRLEASACDIFEKGGPHFTEQGRKVVAQQMAAALR